MVFQSFLWRSIEFSQFYAESLVAGLAAAESGMGSCIHHILNISHCHIASLEKPPRSLCMSHCSCNAWFLD